MQRIFLRAFATVEKTMDSYVLKPGGGLTIAVACLVAPAQAQQKPALPDFSIG
jgi:hypothetical protein